VWHFSFPLMNSFKSIKPRLFFSHAGYASLGFSLSLVYYYTYLTHSSLTSRSNSTCHVVVFVLVACNADECLVVAFMQVKDHERRLTYVLLAVIDRH